MEIADHHLDKEVSLESAVGSAEGILQVAAARLSDDAMVMSGLKLKDSVRDIWRPGGDVTQKFHHRHRRRYRPR